MVTRFRYMIVCGSLVCCAFSNVRIRHRRTEYVQVRTSSLVQHREIDRIARYSMLQATVGRSCASSTFHMNAIGRPSLSSMPLYQSLLVLVHGVFVLQGTKYQYRSTG